MSALVLPHLGELSSMKSMRNMKEMEKVENLLRPGGSGVR